jgi:hypothetical protein
VVVQEKKLNEGIILKDTETTDGEIQLSILTLLYNRRKAKPTEPEIPRDKIIELLAMPEDRIEFNSDYLKEKRLIEILGAYMGGWCWAKITALGIDAIMNKQQRKSIHAFLGLQIPIHIENKIALVNF